MSETKTDDAVEITELEKIEAKRVDGVASPANGVPVLMMKALPEAPPTMPEFPPAPPTAAEQKAATPPPAIDVAELAKQVAELLKPTLNQVVADKPEKGHSKKAGRDKTQIESLVSDAVTKATQGAQAELQALRAELAKVKATVIPGGPVMSITAPPKGQQIDDARARKIAYYQAMAKAVEDPADADGYRQLARQLEEEALNG